MPLVLLLLLFASPLLVLGLWIWLLRALPALFDEAAYGLLNAEVEPASQVRAAWLAVPLYLLAWAAGLLLAQLSTSTAPGLFVAAILIGGTLGAVVRFAYRWRPSGLSLKVGGLLLLPILGYVLGAWLVHQQVVQRWHSLGTPPAASVRLAEIDLWNVTVLAADGQHYTCCTAFGGWTHGRSAPDWYPDSTIVSCTQSGAGWSCAAPDKPWFRNSNFASIPAPPPDVTQLYQFEIAPDLDLWFYYHTYGQLGLAADGRVWEWRRNQGGAFLEPRPQQVSSYAAWRIRGGGLLGLGVGLLLLWACSARLRRQASRMFASAG